MKNLKIFYIFFIVFCIGIYILFYNLTTICKYIYNYNTYEQVNGLVVGYTLDSNNNKQMIIKYTVDKKEYQIQSLKKEDNVFPVGANILVKYNKKKPSKYILGDEKINFANPLIGIGISLIGSFGMMFTYKGKKGE